MNITLTNKVAYITGGSKGIGFGIAQALVQQGVKVAISGRDLKAVQDAAAQLGSEKVLALQSDVRSAAAERQISGLKKIPSSSPGKSSLRP